MSGLWLLLIVVLPLLAVICCPGKEKDTCTRREFDGEDLISGEYPVVTDHHARGDTSSTASRPAHS